MSRNHRTTLLSAIALTSVWACGGDSAGPTQTQKEVASVSLDRTAVTLAVSGRLQLTATGKDLAGTAIANPNITWTSDNAAATVSAGLVTAVSPGVATITASSTSSRGLSTARATITVINGVPGSTTISPSAKAILAGEAVTLALLSFDADGVRSAALPTWTSSNEAVAKVDASGRVTGTGQGMATIRATVDGRTGSADISVALPAAISAVSASLTDVCALTIGGALYCAGQTYGSTPRAVAAQLRFKAIKGFGAPQDTTSGFCAIANDDSAYCWGSNQRGQLGVGDTQDRAEPTLVSGGLKFKDISPGDLFTCGVTLAGAGYCWGMGANGTIGDGAQLDRNVPTRVSLDAVLQQISAGNASGGGASGPGGFACALTDQGKIYCWGSNGTGQLGDGKVPNGSPLPQATASNVNFKALNENNTNFACALSQADELYCWGNGNPLRVLNQCPFFPSGVHSCLPVPTNIEGGLRFTMLSASATGGMCAVTTRNEIACLGVDVNKRFGLSEQLAGCPLGCGFPNIGPTGFVSVSGSVFTNCGLTTSQRAYCWGDNSYQQFADAIVKTTSTPLLFRVPATP